MTHLLPAPRSAGLLPARCPRIVTRVTPDSLTAAQEEVLQAALTHAEAAAEGCYAAAKYGPEWFAVSSMTRPECDGLVLYGYLRPHPDRKLKMWYALTPLGMERARALRLDLEAEAANSPSPCMGRGSAVSPRRGEVVRFTPPPSASRSPRGSPSARPGRTSSRRSSSSGQTAGSPTAPSPCSPPC